MLTRRRFLHSTLLGAIAAAVLPAFRAEAAPAESRLTPLDLGDWDAGEWDDVDAIKILGADMELDRFLVDRALPEEQPWVWLREGQPSFPRVQGVHDLAVGDRVVVLDRDTRLATLGAGPDWLYVGQVTGIEHRDRSLVGHMDPRDWPSVQVTFAPGTGPLGSAAEWYYVPRELGHVERYASDQWLPAGVA